MGNDSFQGRLEWYFFLAVDTSFLAHEISDYLYTWHYIMQHWVWYKIQHEYSSTTSPLANVRNQKHTFTLHLGSSLLEDVSPCYFDVAIWPLPYSRVQVLYHPCYFKVAFLWSMWVGVNLDYGLIFGLVMPSWQQDHMASSTNVPQVNLC